MPLAFLLENLEMLILTRKIFANFVFSSSWSYRLQNKQLKGNGLFFECVKIVRPHECGNFWNCTFFTRIGFRSTPNQWNLSSRPHHFETDLQNGFKARSTRIRRRIPVGGVWIEDELRASLTKIEHSRRGFRLQTDNCHISTATMSFRWYNNSRAPKVEFTDSSVKWMVDLWC